MLIGTILREECLKILIQALVSVYLYVEVETWQKIRRSPKRPKTEI